MSDGLLDWDLARRVAEALIGEAPSAPWVAGEPVAREAARAAALVVDYTELDPGDRVPDGESVDRDEWVSANLEALEGAATALRPRLERAFEGSSETPGWVRVVAARLASAQVGLVVGYAGRRVLGQYELAIVGPPREPRLLFVAPNLTDAGRVLGAEESLLRWIALHEVTHAVHVGSVPWLRDHLGSLVEELIGTIDVRVDGPRLLEVAKRVLSTDPRELIAELRTIDPVRALAGPEQRRVIERMQAAMTAIEGYAEHVMDAVGTRLDPDVARLRSGLEQRRRSRNPLEALLARLLGLDLKLRQYAEGRRFANRVVELGGIEALNLAWRDAGTLPDSAEIAEPEAWLRRVG